MRSKVSWFTVIILWAIVVLGAYYVFHKPFDPQNVRALLKSLRSIGTALLVVSASAGIGRAIYRKVFGASLDEEGPPAIEFGLGFGFLGIVWLGLAMAGLLDVWVAWLVLAATLVGLNKATLEWWRKLLVSGQELYPETTFQRILCACIIILAVASLVNALAPPNAWDELLYHLTSPLRHIQAGRLAIDPALPEAGYPQLVEMHYTWLLLLGTPRATAVLHWFLGVLTTLVLGGLARRWINGQASWIAMALLYSAGTWTMLMGVAYIDLALVFFATMGFQQLIDWIDTPEAKKTALLGVLSGFGFGVKYTGAFIGIAFVILMVWRRPRLALRTLVFFGLAAFLVSMPWLLKNMQMDNPFYPFLNHGVGWDSFRRAWFSQVGSGLLYTNPSQLLAAPVLMIIMGAEGAEMWPGSFGPLMLMLAPAIIIGWKAFREKSWFRYGLAWIVLLYAAWFYGIAISRTLVQPRLLFPLVPSACLLLGGSAASLIQIGLGRLSLGRIVNALIVLVLVLTIFNQMGGLLESKAIEVVLGWESSEDYLYQQLGWYHGAVRYLEYLPEESRVIFLFEPRTYYCPGELCIPDGILDRWYWLRQRGLSNPEILDEWRQEGVTHILIYQLGAEVMQTEENPISPTDWEALDALVRDELIEVENFGNAYVLYQMPIGPTGEP